MELSKSKILCLHFKNYGFLCVKSDFAGVFIFVKAIIYLCKKCCTNGKSSQCITLAISLFI